MTSIAVVGGGITGLVAARRLAEAGAEVTLVEPGPLGGKVQSSAFDGGVLDEAADAFLARVPEGVALCRELGIEGDLVSPAARRAYVWSRGALRLLPEAQVLGVPTDLDELAASGILSDDGLARVAAEPRLTPPAEDVTIGSLVRAQLGDEAAERLVDPLVGGINAGDTDELSLAATVPQLDSAARSGAPSLVEACRDQRARTASPTAPVFFAPRGGMGALSAALASDVSARRVQLVPGAAVAVERSGQGYRATIDLGATDGDGIAASSRSVLAVDGVVLAVPAPVAADLVREVAPRAATPLAAIRYASVALLSLSVPRGSIDRELDGSGFLVPRREGRLTTACSWTSSKWPHLAGDGTVWLRASVGRAGDVRCLALDDADLTEAVVAELGELMGLRGDPVEVRVTRWPDSFPQYRPGHLDVVDRLDATLAEAAPGLVVAGAALRGLGVPACIRQGTAAAVQLARALGTEP
jgi:oxygen-dependent protoporphyrinogen oxidase